MRDSHLDQGGRQRLPEGRHPRIECADGTAVMTDREPVGGGLAGVETAVSEVRQWHIEPDGELRRGAPRPLGP